MLTSKQEKTLTIKIEKSLFHFNEVISQAFYKGKKVTITFGGYDKGHINIAYAEITKDEEC